MLVVHVVRFATELADFALRARASTVEKKGIAGDDAVTRAFVFGTGATPVPGAAVRGSVSTPAASV